MTKKYQYVACRAIGHKWDPVYAGKIKAKVEFGVAVDFLCGRCGKVRRDIFSKATGQRLSRRYIDPEGYRTERTPKVYWTKKFLGEILRETRATADR